MVGRGADVSDAAKVSDVPVDPAFIVVEGLEAAELRLAMKVQHHLDLPIEHRPDQRLLVLVVVAELRSADRCRTAYLVQAQAGNSFGENHFRGGLQDAVA